MFSVKMTKCRQVYTTDVTRKGRQIPPATDIVGVIPHLAQRGILAVFSTDRFLEVLQEIMTETGI